METIYVEDSEYNPNVPFGYSTMCLLLFIIITSIGVAILCIPEIIRKKLHK